MKINRTRIVNLNYNDGKRTIYNECFDYKGGKNTLFSMDNGLGKTVIIQFMLQPFLRRNRDLAKRDFASYFKGPNPVYVMHELLLDDGSKLLIGTLLKGDKNSDEKNRVKVVGFTHKYGNENMFDIEHMAFVKNDDGKNKIITFAEAESLLKTEAKTNVNLNVYNFDDSIQKKRYFDCLISNGIDSKEWETLIKKINQQESGLSELFATCDTTPELLKKQIIPIIEEKLRANEDRIQSLISHSRKYIQTYLQHQQEISKSISYKNFLSEIEEIDGNFDICKRNSNEIDEINEFLKKVFLSINYQIDNKDNNEDDFVKAIAQKEKEIKNVKYQQISYDLNVQKEQIDSIADEMAELRVDIENLDSEISEYENNKSIQECAKHYARLTQKQAALFALKETLKNNEMNESELLSTINDYKVTLKNLYNEELENLNDRVDALNNFISEKTELKNKTNSIIEKLKEDNLALNQKIVSDNIIIKNYEDKESLLASKDELFAESLKDNPKLSKKELMNNFIENIIERESELLKDKDELSEEISIFKNKLSELNASLDEEKETNSKIKNSIYKDELTLETMLKAKMELQSIIQKYDCSEITNKSIKDIKKYIENELEKYSSLQQLYLDNINVSKHQLYNIQNYRLGKLDEEFLKLLSENNIAYITGLEWMKLQNKEIDISEKVEAVRNNPLLLYSLIVADEDLKRISELDLNGYNLSYLPIFTPSTFNKLTVNILSNNNYVINNVNYLVSSEVELLDDKKYENEIAKLQNNIEENKDRLEKLKNDVSILNTDISKINSIEYDEITEKNLAANISDLKNKLNASDKKIETLKQSISSTQDDIEADNSLINSKEKQVNQLYVLRNNCVELTSISEEYDSAKKDETSLESKYNANQKEISTLSNSIIKSDEIISAKNIELMKTTNDIKLLSSKISKIDDVEGDMIDWDNSIEELEQIIEQAESKLSKDVFSIKQDIKNVQEDIDYIMNDISRVERKYGLSEDDYKDVVYNEELLDNYDELIYSKESDKEDIEDKINDLDREKVVYESKYEDILDELAELGYNTPMDYYSITVRDFEDKIDELEAELKELQDNNIESLRLYESFSACINKLKKYIKNVDFSNNEDVAIIKEVKELKVAMDSVDEKLLSLSDVKDVLNKEENKIRFKLNESARKYPEIGEQMKNILLDDDILSVQEKLYIFKDSLTDLLGYLELTTKNIHDEEMFVINEAIEYACSIYSEIIQIDKQSKILINGKNKQMLQIKLPLEEELNKENVEYFMRNMINDIVENHEMIDMDKILSNQIKSVNLFEKIINGFNSVKIYIYKIEKTSLIRKEWNQINRENSGGEQFVSVFILFISLLSYMRNDDENSNTGKVLIMDNPFAKTNAEHLLVPMFDIAKKFNTQLICFSGIGGSSVYNRFDVIYASKIIKDKYRESEILEFTSNEQEAETVEMLGISIEKNEERTEDIKKAIN